jgi:hypothetical protein
MKPNYKWANLSLLATTTIYVFINGAGAFETLVIAPKWAANPPASLGMFQGDYALDFKNFWITAHSLHEVCFIAAIILNWKIAARRRVLLIVFAIHLALRVWTILYFVPNIIAFQQIPVGEVVDETLRQNAQKWKNLNYLREGLFTILSLILIPLNKYSHEKLS